MKLEVGMYVRTENNEIGKIRAIFDDKVFINNNQYYSKIKTQSKNISEVLSVGDIGYMIAYGGLPIFKSISESDILDIKLGNFKVIQVLTKEQFEEDSYKVG